MEKRYSNNSSSNQGITTKVDVNPSTHPSGELNNRNETVQISIRDENLDATWLEQMSKLRCRPKVREFFFYSKRTIPIIKKI